jgi:aarF domain-containing kinase
MGATNTNVNIEKFGNELKAIIQKINKLEPTLVVTTDTTGANDILDARLSVDERETTKIVLEVVGVAERNGLKLPREFGLVLKQVNISSVFNLYC